MNYKINRNAFSYSAHASIKELDMVVTPLIGDLILPNRKSMSFLALVCQRLLSWFFTCINKILQHSRNHSLQWKTILPGYKCKSSVSKHLCLSLKKFCLNHGLHNHINKEGHKCSWDMIHKSIQMRQKLPSTNIAPMEYIPRR